jgi:SNF2 family DNA or RNA helicase
MEFYPYEYQSYAINRIIEQPIVGLFLDMGMGKTICTLTAVAELIKENKVNKVNKVLVIAPLRVAESTWSREAEKFNNTSHLKVAKVLGSKKTREVALCSKADLYVINRENVVWLVDYFKHKWPFDMVIIDELSSFKSHKAKRFKALAKVRKYIKRIVGLTGTPAPNSLMDMWSQMYLLDEGVRLGKSFSGFQVRYFIPDQRNYQTNVIYSWKLKQGADEAIHKKISDICISMESKDWLELPERVSNVISVSLSENKWKVYKKLEKDLLLPFEEGDIVADTAANLTNKLLQMANGAVYDENGVFKEIHDEKLKALEDVIEAANGKPVLVFYNYRHDLKRIKVKFPESRTLESSDEIEKWNKGCIPILLVHPKSAGHGLNLQFGGHILVWFGLTWSLEEYQQANARLYRQGQQHHVIVHHLVTKDTIDEDVMKALEGKAMGQEALINAVKARIESVRNK